MDYISVKEFAQKSGVSERTARNYCASGKIEGVVLVGKTWNIPGLSDQHYSLNFPGSTIITRSSF